MKNKVLIVFKYPLDQCNRDVINKFSNYFETEHLYIQNFENSGFIEIVDKINNFIKEKNIEIVVFDVDYFKFINFFFIEKISCKKKIFFTGDDFELHQMNLITASSCDLILSGCPLSVLKYKEKGHEAYIFHLENGKIYEDRNQKKEIDVLFFGALTPDRNEILNYLINKGIPLKNLGHQEKTVGISEDQLIKLISKSKIVLNLSKSRTIVVKNFASEKIYKFNYQFKGRIIKAGLNGSICVSEYSPGQEILFNDDEIPTFFTKEECVSLLKKLLEDDQLYESYRKKFIPKVHELFEDKKNFEPIYKSINQSINRKVELIKIPYWYTRIAAKQIIIKNIKLSKIYKKIMELKLIYSIMKNTNLIVKLLVIAESILNIVWYSLISFIKSKK